MTEKELRDKYFEMEQKYLDEKKLRETEIIMSSKLKEQIEALNLHNHTLTKIIDHYARKYARIKIQFDNLLLGNEK